MKVYIAGPITGKPNYRDYFAISEVILRSNGATVMNPAILPEGFEQHEYMTVCLAMLSTCDTIALLPGWKNSKGAMTEYRVALATGKVILEFTTLESLDNYQLISHIFTPNKNNH